MHMTPSGGLERQPVAVGFQAKFQQPLGLALKLRDATNYILVKSLGDDVGLDVGHKAVLILGLCRLFYDFVPFFRPFVLFHRYNS